MLLLLITVMIVDVIENRVFWVPSHHSAQAGAPEEQTNGKYGKQRLHVKANQIVVTVHFTQAVPSPPPPLPPLLALRRKTHMHAELQRHLPAAPCQCSSAVPPQMFGALRACCWMIQQGPISTHKENSHLCTEGDEHCSASQVRHSSGLLLISFISAGGAPRFPTNFGHVGEHLGGESNKVVLDLKCMEEKRALLFCCIVNRTRWWKKSLFNFTA